MKNIVLLTFIFALLHTSCVSNDDENYIQNKTINARGAWNLTKVSGGIIGQNENYESKVITWSFNVKNSILTIENNNKSNAEAKLFYDGLPTGKYHFNITEIKNNYFLFIEGNEFGLYKTKGNKLTIDQGITTNGVLSDAYILEFNR